MANSVCVLHPWEAVDLEKNGLPPSCRNHKHVKKIEAMEMTARGDNQPQSKSARWIGPGMICLVAQATWSPRQSGYAGPLVLQMS